MHGRNIVVKMESEFAAKLVVASVLFVHVQQNKRMIIIRCVHCTSSRASYSS
jgi:hypothetical protein